MLIPQVDRYRFPGLDSFGPDKGMSIPLNYKRLSSILLCSSLYTALFCQVTWRRTYGGVGMSEARSVRQTTDGGYIALGSTGSFGNGSSDIYILHLDAFGEPNWSRVYGGLGVDNGIACRELQDGYIIAGTTSLGSNGSYDMLLIRTDLQGELIWERNYGTGAWDICNSVEVLPDGFVLGGITYGGGMLSGAAFIVRTDLNGDTLWTKEFGGPYRMECNGLCVTADQGIVMAGSMETGLGYEDGFVSKLDLDGNQLWLTPIGGDSTDILRSVVEDASGNLVACGITRSGSDVAQIYLISLDAAGQYQWSQFLGNAADAGGTEIRRKLNGGFVFTGFNTLNLGEKDMILTTTDDLGDFQLGNNYGDGHPAEGFSLDPTADGGYVVAGWAEGYGPGLRAMYVVKTDNMLQTHDLTVLPYSDPLPIEDVAQPVVLILYPSLVTAGEAVHVPIVSTDIATARITDTRGALMATIPVPVVANPSLRIPNLAPGPYFLSIERKGLAPVVARFVVMW